MNIIGMIFGGLVSTTVLTTLMDGSQRLGLTRMNIPYLMGTMFTRSRDRAKRIGVFLHFLNGLLFAFIYSGCFYALGAATWRLGAAFGFLQAMFVLIVALPNMPSFHPYMASEYQGPTGIRQLEPPGFLALNYGFTTPLSVILAHVIFGIIVALFYRGAT